MDVDPEVPAFIVSPGNSYSSAAMMAGMGQTWAIPPGRRAAAVHAARLAYAALAVADTVLAVSGTPGAARARWVTKPLLMPVLMVGRDRETRTALALSGVGDVALLRSSDTAFTAGVGAFLAAQLAWVRALRGRRGPGDEHGVTRGLRRRPAVAVPYVLTALALDAIMWRRAGKDRFPAVVYSAALTATALAAAGTGDRVTATGGGLFMTSDALIALDRFAGVRLPAHEGWVMGAYALAQALLARAPHGAADLPCSTGKIGCTGSITGGRPFVRAR